MNEAILISLRTSEGLGLENFSKNLEKIMLKNYFKMLKNLLPRKK